MGGQYTWEGKHVRATMHKSMRYANHPCSSKCGEGEVILPCTAAGTTVFSAKSAPPSLCVFAINIGSNPTAGRIETVLADTG